MIDIKSKPKHDSRAKIPPFESESWVALRHGAFAPDVFTLPLLCYPPSLGTFLIQPLLSLSHGADMPVVLALATVLEQSLHLRRQAKFQIPFS